MLEIHGLAKRYGAVVALDGAIAESPDGLEDRLLHVRGDRRMGGPLRIQRLTE